MNVASIVQNAKHAGNKKESIVKTLIILQYDYQIFPVAQISQT